MASKTAEDDDQGSRWPGVARETSVGTGQPLTRLLSRFPLEQIAPANGPAIQGSSDRVDVVPGAVGEERDVDREAGGVQAKLVGGNAHGGVSVAGSPQR